jgi:hypothetical protein
MEGDGMGFGEEGLRWIRFKALRGLPSASVYWLIEASPST